MKKKISHFKIKISSLSNTLISGLKNEYFETKHHVVLFILKKDKTTEDKKKFKEQIKDLLLMAQIGIVLALPFGTFIQIFISNTLNKFNIKNTPSSFEKKD